MKFRFVCSVVCLGFFVAACSDGSSADSDESVPERLLMGDIVENVQDSTTNNEALADVCRRLYPDTTINSELVVGLVADVASIDDGTFNQAAFEGSEAASTCVGADTVFLEAAENDAALQISSIISRDVDIVVTLGFQFEEATIAAAAERPDLRFIGVDQVNPGGLPNYVAISFDDYQVGFLAGVTAGLSTQSETVAIVAGPDTVVPVVTIADGFEEGVRHSSPDAVVLRKHMDNFDDPQAGARQSEEFVNQGADVVFGAAGDTGTGAIKAAADMRVHVIGVDQDEYFTTFVGGSDPSSDQLLTSAIKRVDLGVFLTITAMATSDVEGGGFLLDIANGGVAYAPFHDADISSEVAAKIEETRLGLVNDEIEVAGANE